MARWFGHAESIDGLLNLWSGRLCILFHYLIMTGMPLEEHACQTRPKAPQIHLPRDIHTLTTFWCYRLSFVAERRGKRLRGSLTSLPTPSEEGGRNLFHLLGVGCPGSGTGENNAPGRVFLVRRTLFTVLLRPPPVPTLGKDQEGKRIEKRVVQCRSFRVQSRSSKAEPSGYPKPPIQP